MCPDLLLIQDIDAHHKEADQMHGMLVQVVLVLLMVPLSDFVVVPDHGIQGIHEGVVVS